MTENFDAYEHYTIFEGFQKVQVDRYEFICQLLQFEMSTGCKIAFIDVNGYPIRRENGKVEYSQKVAKIAQSFILLPKQL